MQYNTTALVTGEVKVYFGIAFSNSYCALKGIADYSNNTNSNAGIYVVYTDCSNLSFVRFYCGPSNKHIWKSIAIGY